MRRGGFSLVEISVVLVIVATMLAGVLPAITEGTKVRDVDATADRMEAIQGAIQSYFAMNQELPCPADITLGVSTANFGVQAANNSCTGGAPAANWFTPNIASPGPYDVVGGGVPTKTLGLPDEYAFDGWGRRIYYHVDPDATVSTTFNAATTGTIRVNDGAGTPRTTSAVYVLVSAGRNGHGAYTRAGGTVRINTGSQNNDQSQNCMTNTNSCTGPIVMSYDNTFVQKLESATSPSDPTTNFDDIVTYKLRGNLLTGDGSGGGDTLWTAAGANIHNTNLAGNVGVGTTTPSSKLYVKGSFTANEETNTAGYQYVGQFAVTNNAAGTNYTRLGVGQNATNTMFIETADQANTKGNLLLQPWGGSVGIGTTTPLSTLEVLSANAASIRARSSNANSLASISLANPNRHWSMIVRGTADGAEVGKLQISDDTAVSNRFTIDTSGNVGIGTTAPGAKLHAVQATATQNAVNGTYNGGGTTYYGVGANAGAYWAGIARADGYGLVTNGHVYTTGDMYYFGFLYDLSDERDKKDIQPLSSQDVLERILKIRPVSFTMKDDKEGRTELGVIAQELEKIFPELVSTAKDEKGTKSVSMIGLIAPMISAIQEQNKMIEAQQQRIDTLEERVKRLEANLEQLQQSMKGDNE